MNKKFFLGALLASVFFLLTSGLVNADFKDSIPKQEIFLYKDGETASTKDPIPTGEIIELVIPKIKETDKPKDLVNVNYNWVVFEIKYDKDGKEYRKYRKSYRPLSDNPVGPSVLFSTGNRTTKFYIEVSASYVFATLKEDKKLDITVISKTLETYVKILSDNPTPEPNPPNPDNPDTPVFPDGRFKLSKLVYDAAMKSVNADKREIGAKVSANAYKSISAAIAAGTIKSIEDALKEVKKANDANLAAAGIANGVWTTFGVVLQNYLFDLYDKNQITTVSDFRDAFLEVAAGLEKVK